MNAKRTTTALLFLATALSSCVGDDKKVYDASWAIDHWRSPEEDDLQGEGVQVRQFEIREDGTGIFVSSTCKGTMRIQEFRWTAVSDERVRIEGIDGPPLHFDYSTSEYIEIYLGTDCNAITVEFFHDSGDGKPAVGEDYYKRGERCIIPIDLAQLKCSVQYCEAPPAECI